MPLRISYSTLGKKHIAVTPLDLKGNPVELDGDLSVEVLSGLGTASVDSDNKGFYAISPDELGEATVYLVSGDGDRGDGIKVIEDTVTADVLPPSGVGFGLVEGTEEPK